MGVSSSTAGLLLTTARGRALASAGVGLSELISAWFSTSGSLSADSCAVSRRVANVGVSGAILGVSGTLSRRGRGVGV